MIKILAVIALVLVSGFAGYQYNEAEHAKTVADLNRAVYNLGVVIQTETNKQAELNRQIKAANRERINAITINDHNNQTIRRLQDDLNKSVSELETLRTDYNYIVLDVVSVARVYDKARNECHGLAPSSASPIVSAELSEFTGDSISEVVRYLTGRYCEVATDYNNLYSDAESLLAGNKKPDD